MPAGGPVPDGGGPSGPGPSGPTDGPALPTGGTTDSTAGGGGGQASGTATLKKVADGVSGAAALIGRATDEMADDDRGSGGSSNPTGA